MEPSDHPYTNEEVIGLMRDALAGDATAFSTIYRSYYTPLYRYLYFRVGHVQDTEDLVKSVFLRGYTGIARSEIGDKSPLAYLYATARNAVDGYWRRKKEIQMRDSTDMVFGGVLPNTAMETPVEGNESVKQVLSGMLHMTPDQQEVVIHKYINGYSTHEVAEIMNKTEMAVQSLVAKALQTLRNFIRE